MGVAVSAWPLARAVSLTGQLGVVSGTGLDLVLARRLQLGDAGGHLRRAMAEFPFPEMADRILRRYFIDGGKSHDAPFAAKQVIGAELSREQCELLVVANFVEVFLAKEGHGGLIGVNYLEKIQVPTLPSLFGAMLAHVDYILMGAGIPRAIPGVIDRLVQGEPVELPLNVEGADANDRFVTRFDPAAFCGGGYPWLDKPRFLAIVASDTLAAMLARKATGRVDGFVIEGPTAGGHNAPPRGAPKRNERGEPIYGERDVPDLAAFRSLGRPFWLAGSYGTPQRVVEAVEQGAAGVQVGTAFAYCNESGLDPDIRRRVLALSRRNAIDVLTDADASPTGFPFKVVQLAGSMSDRASYEQRRRMCDLGYLRHAYRQADGTLGWRCPAEAVDAYVRKGGKPDDTQGRKCVCNGLLAAIGLGQTRTGSGSEKPLVTSGDDVCHLGRFLPTPEATTYSARDVVEYLLSGVSQLMKSISG
ncbi:MAG: nitronate monooxygenase [Planctomycetes bacterium]|nr:nitronate monooxygenase [Planctomycetota bacterium]